MVDSLLDTSDAGLLEDDDFDDLFIRPVKKKKILFLSDHPLATSGVGTQARFLIEGLIKTGKYSFRCLGGALKHDKHDVVKVNDDFIIMPVDNFGTKELIRQLLITEKPDALILFTDPRQFIWLWEIEDEIHQVCPITYWHVWDNGPYPEFNRPWYESTDQINCLSKKTFDLISPRYPDKTRYIPHALPESLFFRLPDQQRTQFLTQNFGPRANWFKALWVNRNATRKVPADVLMSWKLFLDKLERKHSHRNALMIMHTDPHDVQGPNLIEVSETLGLQNNVWFSTEKVDFAKMNILHNMADCTINIAKAEGFGLGCLQSLQVGRPIIALKTGGETSKVVDPKDGTEHGVGIEPIKRLLVGSQSVPYIYEDYAGTDDVVNAFMKLYEMPQYKRDKLSKKCEAYAKSAFRYEDMISSWDESLTKCIDSFKEVGDEKRVELITLLSHPVAVEEYKTTHPTEETSITPTEGPDASTNTKKPRKNIKKKSVTRKRSKRSRKSKSGARA